MFSLEEHKLFYITGGLQTYQSGRHFCTANILANIWSGVSVHLNVSAVRAICLVHFGLH